MLAGSKGTASYEVLMSDGYKKVRDNNIDLRVSFNKSRWNMAKTINTPNTAYYGIKEYVLGIEKFECKVKIEMIQEHILILLLLFTTFVGHIVFNENY